MTVYLRHRFRRYFRPAAARGTDSDPKFEKNSAISLYNSATAGGGPHHIAGSQMLPELLSLKSKVVRKCPPPNNKIQTL